MTLERSVLPLVGRSPGTRRQVNVLVPTRTLPTGIATIGIGLALVAGGAMATHPAGYQTLTLQGVTTQLEASKVVDRRRRFVSASQALSEIRLWTGLAWTSLADMLSVTRRAVHQWASGAEPTGARAEALIELHGRASALAKHGQATAAALLAAQYRIQPKELRASPRKSTPINGAMLTSIDGPLSAQPQSLGVRKMRRSGEA